MERPVSTAFFYTALGASKTNTKIRSPEKKNKISPFSQRPRWTPPLSMFPQRGPCGERGSVSRANSSFIHSFINISQSLKLRSSPWWNDTEEKGSTQR